MQAFEHFSFPVQSAHLVYTLPRFVPCVPQRRTSSVDIGITFCFLMNIFAYMEQLRVGQCWGFHRRAAGR